MARSRTSSNGTGFIDHIAINQLRQQVQNWCDSWGGGPTSVFDTLAGRQAAYPAGKTSWEFVGDQCGWPAKDSPWAAETYRWLYDTDPIARTVVQLYPKECWRSPPEVTDQDDPSDEPSKFMVAFRELGAGLTGYESWHSDSEFLPIFDYFKRANFLSRIGQFGVTLCGFDDGKNLQDPVDGVYAFAVADRSPIRNAKGRAVGTRVRIRDEPAKFDRLKDEKLSYLNAHDCFMPRAEEERLRKLEGLTDNEARIIDSWAKQRDDYVKDWERRKFLWNEHIAGRTFAPTPAKFEDVLGLTREAARNLADGAGYAQPQEVVGTDLLYPAFGLGMADPVNPALPGTDQQYFGVQFGPSEVPAKKPRRKGLRLVFIRPYDQSLVQVVRWEWNINNPRFGMPVMYRITLNDPREIHSGIGLPMATVFVHWTRVIHHSEVEGSSNVFAVPKMQPVLGTILDMRKIRGASAEGYRRGAFAGVSLETHPQLGGDVLLDKPFLQQMLQDYQTTPDKGMVLTGMSAKTLPPSVTDPKSYYDVQIKTLCIQLRCPERVLVGSPRGEVASAQQDDEDWNECKAEFQVNTINPVYLIPFIDRMVVCGVLPVPEGEGYACRWPDPDALGDKDRAAIMLQHTQAYAAFVQSGMEQIMTFKDYLIKERGLTAAEAEELVKNAEGAEEDALSKGFEPAPPPGFQKPKDDSEDEEEPEDEEPEDEE